MGNDCKVYWYMLFLASFIWPWPFVTFVIFDGLVLCSISNTCRSIIYFLYNDICPCPQFHDSVFFPLFLRYMYYIWQCIIRKRSTTCLYIVYTCLCCIDLKISVWRVQCISDISLIYMVHWSYIHMLVKSKFSLVCFKWKKN